jgi:hypothetical protein
MNPREVRSGEQPEGHQGKCRAGRRCVQETDAQQGRGAGGGRRPGKEYLHGSGEGLTPAARWGPFIQRRSRRSGSGAYHVDLGELFRKGRLMRVYVSEA